MDVALDKQQEAADEAVYAHKIRKWQKHKGIDNMHELI